MEAYVLYPILLIASIWDFKYLKIPNALIVLGMGAGVALSYVDEGMRGAGFSVLSMLVVFLLFLPTWLFFGVGAGDVKLLMVTASFVGMDKGVAIGFDSIFLSAFAFLFLLSKTRVAGMFQEYFNLLFYRIPILLQKNEKQKMPFALFVFLATLLEMQVL